MFIFDDIYINFEILIQGEMMLNEIGYGTTSELNTHY